METTTYPMLTDRSAMRTLMGMALLIFGIFACLGSVALPALSLFLTSDPTGGDYFAFGFIAVCIGSIALGMAIAGVLLLRGLSNQLELSSESLTYRRWNRTTTLTLSTIKRVEARFVRSTGRYSSSYWAMYIQDQSNQLISFHLADFDTRAMLSELLPQLPHSAEVNLLTRTYIETGELKR